MIPIDKTTWMGENGASWFVYQTEEGLSLCRDSENPPEETLRTNLGFIQDFENGKFVYYVSDWKEEGIYRYVSI